MNRIACLLASIASLTACVADVGGTEEVEAQRHALSAQLQTRGIYSINNAHIAFEYMPDDIEVNTYDSTVTTPKPPWPATCGALNDKQVSISMDGPDGGTCTIGGMTANCTASSSDTCTCDLANETKQGDCNSDGSKDTFADPPVVLGSGF